MALVSEGWTDEFADDEFRKRFLVDHGDGTGCELHWKVRIGDHRAEVECDARTNAYGLWSDWCGRTFSCVSDFATLKLLVDRYDPTDPDHIVEAYRGMSPRERLFAVQGE